MAKRVAKKKTEEIEVPQEEQIQVQEPVVEETAPVVKEEKPQEEPVKVEKKSVKEEKKADEFTISSAKGTVKIEEGKPGFKSKVTLSNKSYTKTLLAAPLEKCKLYFKKIARKYL